MSALFLLYSVVIAAALVLFIIGMFRRFETPNVPDRLIWTSWGLAFFASCLPVVEGLPFWMSLLAFFLIGLGAVAAHLMQERGLLIPTTRPRIWALVATCMGLSLSLCAIAAVLLGIADSFGTKFVALVGLVLSLDMVAYGLWLLRARMRAPSLTGMGLLLVSAIAIALSFLWALTLPGAVSLMALIISTLVCAYAFVRGRSEQDLAPMGLLMTSSFGACAAALGLIDGSPILVFVGAFFAVAALSLLPKSLAGQGRSLRTFLLRA